MSKKYKSQASSARAASALTGGFGFGSSFQTSTSSLSYVTELPDLSQISEPNVVVALKNLGKKDSTTKAKALEELQDHCSKDVEQGVLQAWADIYPRTSIDNSRRVRQLAHNLQGSLTVLAGKRIAPLLPKVIGSWLAGTFDSDKSVSRSAQEALEKSFSTPEKRRALWTLYQDALFKYIEDAITVQTIATLSDERTTSVDDAQAKYVRVVGTAMNMLSHLLKDDAQHDLVVTLLSGKRLWEFVYHGDPYLRRSVCDLVIIANEKHSNQLDWTAISTCFLSKGLHSSQIGSSRQYSTALLTLTQQRPQLWTDDYTAKTAISKRLSQFLKQGSQTGPEVVWSNIALLIRLIPELAWLGENYLDSATNLSESLRTGVTQPSERMNAAAAWATYVQTCLWLTEKLSLGETDFINQQLIPIVRQYVARKEEQQWVVVVRAVAVCKGVLTGLIKQGMLEAFDSTWSDLVSSTIDAMKLSQPETSKDFKSSQEAVIDQARRLYSIKSGVLSTEQNQKAGSAFEQGDEKLLEASIQLLQNRNGKPYGAAGIIELIVNQPGYNQENAILQSFLTKDLPGLLNSASSEKLAAIALICGKTDVVNTLIEQRSANTEKALRYVLAHIKSEDLNLESQGLLSEKYLTNLSDHPTIMSVMQNPALKNMHSIICDQLQQSLSANATQQSQDAAVTLLEEMLVQSGPTKIVASDTYRSGLLSKLLVLADSGSSLLDRVNVVVGKLNNQANSGAGSTSIIQQQLSGEGTPLSIFTLIDLANGVAQAAGADINAILPTSEMWQKALQPHMVTGRPYSLAITSPLQGSIYVVESENGDGGLSSVRDQDDFSLAFRLILYVTKILTSDLAPKFGIEHQKSLYLSYPLALQLVNEKLTVENANDIWIQTTPEVLHEAAEVLSEGNKLIQSWLKDEDFVSTWIKIPHEVNDLKFTTYLTSLAWNNVATFLVDQNGPSQLLKEYDNEMSGMHKSSNLLKSASILSIMREYLVTTSYGNKVLNEMVASVTDFKTGAITPLILLNILLQGDSDGLDAIPARRLVFLMNNLIRLVDDRETTGVQPEVFKLLAALVPHVSDIYGEHWEQIMAAIVKTWSGEMNLPAMNASLRLYVRLKSVLKADDVNEDLQDAWKTSKPELDTGLLDCLQQLGKTTPDIDQPRTITAELVRRQLRDVDLKNDGDMFSLLSSPVEAVQSAAYEILHRAIPQQQEQLSIEYLLEQRTVRLPPELVSFLSDDDTDSRKYMLAWKLIFDHFSGASHKLQEAYVANIKDSGAIAQFLDFVCEKLRIVGGRPVDASKYDIANFDIDEAEFAERESQWLVIHNYYQALLHVPSLAKDWFISQKNRTKSPLEAWTQKYISPMIVAASLSTVVDWASTQPQDDDDKPLTVKSAPRGSEITAAITVDPESPPISLAISLPGTYPLESPVVTSRTRVGVSEKNWQSWLRTIQIIIFSTGSIIEGLVAFRRNVQGALTGQTECAICYSIIGTDMQTPNKKCGTCKNMFHGTCLFRWFKSSNSSSCPLCRNNFNYA